MNFALLLLNQSAADAFADKAIEWLFAAFIVVAVGIALIRNLKNLF
jgi:hypothetical protein